jgi:redox-sensitive bicupin YhaK (pirin superfamily)
MKGSWKFTSAPRASSNSISLSDGLSRVDEYPIGWHPHRGFDICTYLIEGVGRHADSLGNRETFSAPGMQWCAVGSGIEHAEAGGTPAGANTTGFQIWVNVPSAKKMDPPRYGTVPSEALAAVALPGGVVARVLAGPLGAARGPFETVQPLEMVHYELPAGASVTHEVGAALDNALVYVFRGGVAVGGAAAADASIPVHGVARFDASDAAARALTLTAGSAGAGLMLFGGKMLKQPIAWHGPIVMTTDAEVACPDPYCGGRFRITRIGSTTFRHGDVTLVPLPADPDHHG